MLSKIILFLIGIYQKYLSFDTGIPKKIGIVTKQTCFMYPTCSEYMKQAVIKHGAIKGVFLGVKRLGRCHPWQKKLFDPIP